MHDIKGRNTNIPSLADIELIPLSRGSEYDLSEREIKIFRSRLYNINKDGIRRYRTMRHGSYLTVWRIE